MMLIQRKFGDKRKIMITLSYKENSIRQMPALRMLQVANKEIQLLKAKTDKLREQKKGMMQLLLTGKKRLKIEKQ